MVEKQKPPIVEGQILTVDYGRNLIIPVYGETAAQGGKQTALKTLYKKYGNKHLQFSLTPICQYQVNAGWPERPFLNVNLRGSMSTDKDNWLGFIQPVEAEKGDAVRLERKKYIEKLIKLGEMSPLIISGKIIKEDKEYSMLLFASRKWIDETLKEVSVLSKTWDEERKRKQKKNIIIKILKVIGMIFLGAIYFIFTIIGAIFGASTKKKR